LLFVLIPGAHIFPLSRLPSSSNTPSKKPKKTAALMADVYDEHKDVDGFLYMTFSGENTFGGAVDFEEEEEEEGEGDDLLVE
jgi:hypothetical protein